MIQHFLHCKMCLDEKPAEISAANYAALAVGVAKDGRLIVWCQRHDALISAFALKTPINAQCSCCQEAEKQ